MAKRSNGPICDRCETPLRAAVSFCPSCGGPTAWASHHERVDWEVRQWRASRSKAEADAPQMMLVRTEVGYQPMAVARYNQYVWDQPLHPEREPKPEAPRPVPAVAVADPPPRPPEDHPNGLPIPEPAPPPVSTAPEPAVDLRPEPGTAEPGVVVEPVPADGSLFGSEERVTISKRAVALALALVIGLPLGGKIIGLASGPGSGVSAGTGASEPFEVVAARSGFEQLSPDAVRYAVVIHNPNEALSASDVTIDVAVHDAKGRLVGRDNERVPAVPPAGAMAVTGAVGVSGRVAKMSVEIGTRSFEETTAVAFRVRKVQWKRSGRQVVVQARISGTEPVENAKVVVVYMDRAGRVVGGDFSYLDVPRAPESAKAVISTTGVGDRLARVEVYVLPR